MSLACSKEGRVAGKRQSPGAGSKMEEVRSWKWEEMVGPAARLEENVREELKPQSLVSGQNNQLGATS